MYIGPEQRKPKLLVIGQHSRTQDGARLLLTSMGCQCLLPSSVREAVALIAVENPAAAVLDADAADFSSSPSGSLASELCEKLLGRVVILSDDTITPQLADLIRHYLLPRAHRERLFHELWPTLESLLYPNPVFLRIKRVARLLLDSFQQPLPAGVRGSQLHGRRLLYGSGSLMADLWLEPHSESSRVTLIGQITDTAMPQHRFDGLAVILQGQNGTIGNTATNEFGEFQLDFDFELNATLEVEIRAGQCLSISLPALRRAALAD